MQAEISNDFFNNVATIAVVLMFAKVATHGLRKVRGKPTGTHPLAVLHAIAVIAAIVAVTASLIATHKPSGANGLDVVAWWGIGIAAFALILDIAIEEISDARLRIRSRRAGAEGGEPNGSTVRQAHNQIRSVAKPTPSMSVNCLHRR